MSKSLRALFSTSFIWWILASAIALYFLIPLDKHIRFGMDLAGGTYIGLEVNTDKAVENELIEHMQSALSFLTSIDKSPENTSVNSEKGHVILNYATLDDARSAEENLYQFASAFKVTRDGNEVILSLSGSDIERIKKDAVTSNIEVLKSRLDTMGVSETPIAAKGENRIFIELPDVHDPMQAKKMIGSSAVLEFKPVEAIGRSEEDILDQYDGILPDGTEIIPGKEMGEGIQTFYLVPQYTDITGKLLQKAWASSHQETRRPIVNFQFKPIGVQKFGDLTEENIGGRIAIILDNKVITAPTVRTRIDGSGFIEGQHSPEEAKELAVLLKSGAFVAPVTFEEERTIEPSLGRESIKKGLISSVIGLGLLLIFGVATYSVAGFFAFIVLLFNMLLILLALAALGATLTLPGIAGIVLTMGMAIDSSVIIYERIKELLAQGKTYKAAVYEGFSNASAVILDANITTFIVGVVLYWLGTGPIQGFAVTMMIGIISTLLTGLFLLRSIFAFMFDIVGVQKIKI